MATRAPSSIPANVVQQYTGVTVEEITAQLNRQTLQERTQSDAIEPVVMKRRNPSRKVNQKKKGMPSSVSIQRDAVPQNVVCNSR